MAKVNVRFFGVMRADSGMGNAEIDAACVGNMLDKINGLLEGKLSLTFADAMIYINGVRCKSKKSRLKDGDEVLFISPATVSAE